MNIFRSSFKRAYSAYLKRRKPVEYARSLGVVVGESCRLYNVSFSSEAYLITLGDHVSASSTHFETHDGGVWVLRQQYPNIDIVQPIRVGNNVYFGFGAMVMPGVTIGDNVVVGAGTIVTRDIPSNSVAVGVPARVIKTVDEYAVKALSEARETKQLTPEQKRDWYLKEYRDS